MGAAIWAWPAEECSRLLGQELLSEGEKLHEGMVSATKERELVQRKKFRGFRLLKGRCPPKFIVGSRWARTWEMIGGEKNVKARLVAMACRNPDLKEGRVETPGCASLRSSFPQGLPLGIMKERSVWGLANKNGFLRLDGFLSRTRGMGSDGALATFGNRMRRCTA